jgi:DNA polymerase
VGNLQEIQQKRRRSRNGDSAALTNYPVPDFVWDEYHIDQEINDRGVRLDMDLVEEAIEMDSRSRKELTAAMKE